MVRSPFRGWSAIQWKDIDPGAQTERRGGAGPVRGLLGGKDLTGRFVGQSRLGVVVQDRADATILGEQRIAAVAEQVQVERLVGLLLAVAVDDDGEDRKSVV